MNIAVFGGSFDPVHLGHVAVADAVQAHCEPETLLWVPVGQAPHKREADPLDGELRAQLLDRLVENRPGEEVCRFEIQRPGPSYTVETLEHLAGVYPGARFSLLLGGDSQEHWPSWRSKERILELAELVFVPRRGWEHLLPQQPGSMLTMECVDLEATAIRERLQSGDPCTDALPACVAAMISEARSYQS